MPKSYTLAIFVLTPLIAGLLSQHVAIGAFLAANPAVLTVAVPALASLFDALWPQPAEGSVWYWPRKAISTLALNILHATNAKPAADVKA